MIYISGNKLYCTQHGKLRFSAYSRDPYCEACRREAHAKRDKQLMEQTRSGRGISQGRVLRRIKP